MAAYDNVQLPAGPTPASYAPKLLDFSALANIGQQFQEGQQYGVKRGIQTAFKDGIPRDQNGNPDYNALASRMLQVGATPEAAQPYFDMAIKQGLAPGNQSLLSGQQPQQQGGQQQQPPQQTFTLASNAATGPGGITGNNPRSGPPGSILRDGEQIMGDGAAPQEGAGRGGLPAPFAGTRDQQTAQAWPPAGARTVTEDGTTGQPSAPTSGREVGHNGPQDSRMVAADRLDAQAALLQAQAAKYGQSPAAVKTLQDRAQQLSDKAKQYREAALKDSEATPEQKNLTSGVTGQAAVQKQTIDQSGKTWEGVQASATQYERDIHPVSTLAHGILSDPQMYSGIGAQASLNFNKIKDLFGAPKAAALQQGLEKINAITTLGAVNQQRDQLMEAGGASARIFSQQIEQVVKSNPNLDNTVWGNRMLVTIMDRIGQRSVQIRDMALDYRAKHGGVLDDGFTKQVAQYVKSNPAFTDQEAANPTILGAPEMPVAIKGKADAQAAWKTSQGLKSGDPYRTPDGIRYVK